jgi:hypothetical protein
MRLVQALGVRFQVALLCSAELDDSVFSSSESEYWLLVETVKSGGNEVWRGFVPLNANVSAQSIVFANSSHTSLTSDALDDSLCCEAISLISPLL